MVGFGVFQVMQLFVVFVVIYCYLGWRYGKFVWIVEVMDEVGMIVFQWYYRLWQMFLGWQVLYGMCGVQYVLVYEKEVDI